jgi:hypothetical protein
MRIAVPPKPCIGILLILLARCTATVGADDSVKLPPAAAVKVDFDKHIKPILRTSCLQCHSRGKFKGGLSLETRAATLRGGEGGAPIILGKSAESLVIRMVAGQEQGRRMPAKGQPLSAEQIGLLRAWIDQGLAWPDGFSFGFRQAPVEPRRVQLPPMSADRTHPIDRFVAQHHAEQGLRDFVWNPTSDQVFARRVYLDLIGLLPTPEQLSEFEHDTRIDKRARLVEQLLSNRRAYADHWLTFWNDALRNAYRGTGFIDSGRKSITPWLYQSLYDNKPYDRFVHELISPVPGSEGFIKGIVWRGVVNASQVPAVQAAQNVSQVFLGTNLKCASCHDSFVNAWKLTDAYALAAVFSEKPLEIHRCDKPTGQMSSVGFIYPQLGKIDAGASREVRLKQLADLVVKADNGRFARTIVNRLWAQMMGRGLIEPLDDMDQLSWSQDLLDWLAGDFVAHGHDLKHTLALIGTSRAYQLPSVGAPRPEEKAKLLFRGPVSKRMTAEQLTDAISSVTGIWQTPADGLLPTVRAVAAASATESKAGAADAVPIAAQWVWSHADAANDPGGRIMLRKVIRLTEVPQRAVVVAMCDNEVVFYVNGAKVGESADWNWPVIVDITRHLKVGENVLAAEATNWPDVENNRGTHIKGANPAAFLAWVGGVKGERVAWSIGSDASWLWAKKPQGDWKRLPYVTDGWAHAVELPNASKIYGKQGDVQTWKQQALLPVDVRAALAHDDPLQAILGRTSREQVVTRRDSIATMLQSLELTNGATLNQRLLQGAQRRFLEQGKNPDALISSLFRTALGRAPAPREVEVARDLLGTPVSLEGVQDLLWAVTMLPEFQMVP